MTSGLRYIGLSEAKAVIGEWHAHHKPHIQQHLAIGYESDGRLVAAVIVEWPKAAKLNGKAYEVSRLCVGPDAPHCAASQLLGAVWRSMRAVGCRRLISYTRQDEDGTCYRAAGWVPVALVEAKAWDNGAKPGRWLPGLYREPSTEVVARVRWEIGPDAATTRVRRLEDGTWTQVTEAA